jgi:hypothetical protein
MHRAPVNRVPANFNGRDAPGAGDRNPTPELGYSIAKT